METTEAQEFLTSMADTAMTGLSEYGPSILYALIILFVGMWLSRVAKNVVRKGLDRTGKIDPTVSGFLSNLVKWLIFAITLMAVLGKFGVETTSIVALLGAAGLAVGLALQGTLSNVAAGVMLLIFRPFKLGDFIDAAGIAGTVDEIGLFNTHMNTPDNVHIVVPNAKIWGSEIKNFNHNPTRRVDLGVGISYDDDMDKALKIVESVIKGTDGVLTDPEPVFAIGNLGDSSVDLIVRFWCKREDYWALKWATTKAVKEAFDKEDVSIPYPHLTAEIKHLNSAD